MSSHRTLSLIPALRLGFLQVDSNAYSESGAGALDLNVRDQTYRELLMIAELGARYKLTQQVTFTTRGSIGYNTLDTATQITAAFAGGGTPFDTVGPRRLALAVHRRGGSRLGRDRHPDAGRALRHADEPVGLSEPGGIGGAEAKVVSRYTSRPSLLVLPGRR